MPLSPAREALRKYFGYDSFRPMQAEIIGRICQAKDALVLMPTGGGKSICYQIPAITLPGTGVVVSPLISLMKDQVEGLLANGVRAAFLNSSLSEAEQRQVEDKFFNGELDLLYVSPEKLVSQNFIPLLKRAPVNLFAIDEVLLFPPALEGVAYIGFVFYCLRYDYGYEHGVGIVTHRERVVHFGMAEEGQDEQQARKDLRRIARKRHK